MIDSALRDALQLALGPSYRIERELGGGGMSLIILASDLSLDRKVVVKVLPSELSAVASVDRFRREIQLIAALQHPHVVPILSTGEADGTLYYVMPFLAGESLRDRLARDGPLHVTDAVRILRDTLDALAFAHAHGVIHRDIKPANILLSAGHAVVADFGVSKALQDAGANTTAGLTVGTPAYMAPEQAAADPSTDHRADLYSVAIVAYEMFTGSPPFSGTPSQVIRSHFSEAPVSLRQRRSDVPEALADAIMRALEKEPDQRPQTAAEMISVLDATVTPTGSEGAMAYGAARAPMGAASVRSRGRWIAAAVGVVLTATASAWYLNRPTMIQSAQSMAITPFSVGDGDTALVRLAQNLVTTISANLDGVGEIRVADPMAVLSNANAIGRLLSVSAAVDLARRLGARSAIVGSLTRTGTNVRADLSMYDVAAPTVPLFRSSTTMPADGIAALTDSLTWSLLRGIWAKGRAPTTWVSSIDTRSPAALRDFLEGERLIARGLFLESAPAFERAIGIDTTFWFAYHRYEFANSWYNSKADTTLTHRLRRHLDALPERERIYLSARDTSTTVSSYARQLVEINTRFRDYVPALQAYGELLTHLAPRAGYEPREAIAPFERLATLMPSDIGVVSHWVAACMVVGDLPCLARGRSVWDELAAADTTPLNMITSPHRGLRALVEPVNASALDSLVKAIRADGHLSDNTALLVRLGPILGTRPYLLRNLDRFYGLVVGAPGAVGREARAIVAVVAAGRGDPKGIDSLRAVFGSLAVEGPRLLDRFSANEAQVLLELQGLREPTRATADEALSHLAQRGTTASERVQAIWIVGVNALLRGDSALLRAQLATLDGDAVADSRLMARSLRALRLGRGGSQGVAAESLLVVEREHGERLNANVFWTTLVADRIIAAEWLANAGRPAPADSLLRYLGARPVSAPHTIGITMTFGAAQLLRSRIAEDMGRTEDAIGSARIFLAVFDRAGPVGKARIREATDRLVRLGGSLDGLPVTVAKK